MIGHVRREHPAVRIVLGGGLVTSWMRRPGWRNPFAGLVDALVAGPGEASAAGPARRRRRLRRVHVPPDYSSLPLSEYLSPGLILPYSAADGCWWNRCSFCPERAEGNDYRPLPPHQVLADLRLLTESTGPALIHLLDNAISPALLRALADHPPGAPWYGFARIDERLADPDFCRALKRSGCVMLKLGLESGDQGVLDRMGKGVDLGMAARVLASLRQAGIAVYCYLLFGTPGETVARGEADAGVRRPAPRGDRVSQPGRLHHAARRGRGGRLRHGAVLRGRPLALHRLSPPPGLGPQAGAALSGAGIQTPPGGGAIIRRDPPHFTSNHAPFLAGR